MERRIEKLNLEDDFLFAKVMSDMEICRKVLEKILGISIKKVEVAATQRSIDILLEGKGVRLDVYVNDEKGAIYNVEMQRGRKNELPKRSRYYQGSVDLDLISSGEPYSTLRKTYIIFICTFDPFGEGRHLYTFKNTCQESHDLLLGDETEKVFLNTRGTQHDVDDELIELLSYIENTTDDFVKKAKSSLIGEIHKKVIQVKQSKELEVEYMTLFQRDRENQEIGREEGREEGTLQATRIIKLYSKGMQKQEIAEQLGLEAAYVESTIKSYEEE